MTSFDYRQPYDFPILVFLSLMFAICAALLFVASAVLVAVEKKTETGQVHKRASIPGIIFLIAVGLGTYGAIKTTGDAARAFDAHQIAVTYHVDEPVLDNETVPQTGKLIVLRRDGQIVRSDCELERLPGNRSAYLVCGGYPLQPVA